MTLNELKQTLNTLNAITADFQQELEVSTPSVDAEVMLAKLDVREFDLAGAKLQTLFENFA